MEKRSKSSGRVSRAIEEKRKEEEKSYVGMDDETQRDGESREKKKEVEQRCSK